jgi:uncharacterized protein (TIGR04255 family)
MYRSGEDAGTIRFNDPPVRRVMLTIRFHADVSIQASHVAPLRVRWAEEFPIAEELPPFPPIDAYNEAPTFLSSEDAWPLPYTRYTTNNGDRSIAFQNDRFSVAWHFDPGAPRYPGFAMLSGELERKFTELTEELSKAGIVLTVRGARCDYSNKLDRIAPAEAAVGVLTDWAAQPSQRAAEAPAVHTHLHPCGAQEEHGCNATVSVQSDDTGTLLRLSAERWIEENSDDEIGGLREAHDELVKLFIDFTTSEQRERWGQE